MDPCEDNLLSLSLKELMPKNSASADVSEEDRHHGSENSIEQDLL